MKLNNCKRTQSIIDHHAQNEQISVLLPLLMLFKRHSAGVLPIRNDQHFNFILRTYIVLEYFTLSKLQTSVNLRPNSKFVPCLLSPVSTKGLMLPNYKLGSFFVKTCDLHMSSTQTSKIFSAPLEINPAKKSIWQLWHHE